MQLANNEQYDALVEECRSIITERVYNSRMELIVGYKEVGERIYHDPLYRKSSVGNQEFVDRLFQDIGISKSTGYKCIQFYEKIVMPYKELENWLNTTPDGKNISWSKICNKYLPGLNGEPPKEESCEHNKLLCVNCHKTFNREELK